MYTLRILGKHTLKAEISIIIESLNVNKAAGTDGFMTKYGVLQLIYQDHAQ